ncbi:MAG: NAD-dependent epimerase/dehydratase family protein [Gemmatimonadales bacterium]
MSDILVLGGSRNLGHITAVHLLEAGHAVSVLNRGVTPDELPPDVERIRATRGDESFANAIKSRRFDLVLDMTTYNADDAREGVGVFRDRTERYVFVSSGQVYLVRDAAQRPFVEESFAGAVMSAPPQERVSDYDSWKYGVDKRDAEEVFAAAWESEKFPVTTLRLPMVASTRDHYGRIQGYFARLDDGSPILVPDEHGLPIRHVYAPDVARVIEALTHTTVGLGRAYNVSQERSLSLPAYFELLREVTGISPNIVRAPRARLEEMQLLPDCSSFSGAWMSELDASRTKREILPPDFSFTDPAEYLPVVLHEYRERWIPQGKIPATYLQRDKEMSAAAVVSTLIANEWNRTNSR